MLYTYLFLLSLHIWLIPFIVWILHLTGLDINMGSDVFIKMNLKGNYQNILKFICNRDGPDDSV